MFLLSVRRRLCVYMCNAIIMGLSLVIRKLQEQGNCFNWSKWIKLEEENTLSLTCDFDSRGHQSGLVHLPVYSVFKSVQLRTVWRFLKKPKMELPYDPAIPLLGIYPEKTVIQKETCTTMFTAALFTVAKTQKQLKFPSTDEWIKKMWHIYTMEYYSAIKRNKIELFVVRWMDLETVIQSEVSQKEKQILYANTYIWNLKTNKQKWFW